jgi:hypothetical protein
MFSATPRVGECFNLAGHGAYYIQRIVPEGIATGPVPPVVLQLVTGSLKSVRILNPAELRLCEQELELLRNHY